MTPEAYLRAAEGSVSRIPEFEGIAPLPTAVVGVMGVSLEQGWWLFGASWPRDWAVVQFNRNGRRFGAGFGRSGRVGPGKGVGRPAYLAPGMPFER